MLRRAWLPGSLPTRIKQGSAASLLQADRISPLDSARPIDRRIDTHVHVVVLAGRSENARILGQVSRASKAPAVDPAKLLRWIRNSRVAMESFCDEINCCCNGTKVPKGGRSPRSDEVG